MYRKALGWTAGVACVFLMVSVVAPPAMASARTEAADSIRQFTLDEDFLHRWMAIKRDAVSRDVHLQLFRMNGDGMKPIGGETLGAMSEHLDREPGVHELLADHDMTARDFVLGFLALMTSRMALVSHAQVAGVNPDNVDFVRAHQQEIDRFIKADMRAQTGGAN